MGAQQYHTFVSENGPNLYVNTTDAQTLDTLLIEIRKRMPRTETKVMQGGCLTRIHKLSNQDIEIGADIKNWLLTHGWDLVGKDRLDYEDDYYQYTFRRRIPPAATYTERVPDIADQLEKLVNLHKSGAISTAEFEAAKRKLLGT